MSIKTQVYDLSPSVNLDISARNTNATTNGADVNRTGFEATTLLIIGRAITDGTHTYKLQEADDNGSGAPGAYTDVAASQLVLPAGITTNAVPAVANTIRRMGYAGNKKWVRSVLTVAGATTGGTTGCIALLSGARDNPVANP